jgi:4-hydroxy-3-polyprenylbenzoate decarboxylase
MRPVYPVDRVKLEDFFTKEQISNATGRLSGWTQLLARTGR